MSCPKVGRSCSGMKLLKTNYVAARNKTEGVKVESKK